MPMCWFGHLSQSSTRLRTGEACACPLLLLRAAFRCLCYLTILPSDMKPHGLLQDAFKGYLPNRSNTDLYQMNEMQLERY